MEIIQYTIESEIEWDDFVLNSSMNGTILQTRNFLNYHPPNRFRDCSLLVKKKGEILAAIPACEIYENGKKTFYSHKGSTFGGIVVSKGCYKAESMITIVEMLDEYLIKEEFNQVILKITSELFAKEDCSLLEYCLFKSNYNNYKEVGVVIDYYDYNDDILSNFSQGKRTNYNNCVKANMNCKELTDDEEVKDMYEILRDNLRKFNVDPVHTYDEVVDLKNNRLKNEASFWGCFLDGKQVAGSMMFHFNNASCVHAQYLCADQYYNKLSPITFLYYNMISIVKDLGYRKLSWGIATENNGKTLNMGLMKAKESYGGKYCINKTFYKEL